jgi:hypothetical protein
MNMNMNMNMNMGGVAHDGTFTRVRFNTADFRKLVTGQAPLVPQPFPRYPEYWDAELRSYAFLQDFVGNVPKPPTSLAPGPDWYTETRGNVHTLQPTPVNTSQQIVAILDKAADRDDRFAEIIHQHDAEGAVSYYLGMLMIEPARHPKANLVIRVARRIGELVVMCLKEEFHHPRPSQISSAIVPMIDPPATPSFPSGHALQARLITRCLEEVLEPNNTHPANMAGTPLRELGARIAENRVIAGVHFPLDNEAGIAVADRIFDRLKRIQRFTLLVGLAHTELSQT